MSYGEAGFNAALGGVTGVADFVALHQVGNDPGSNGAGYDATVGAQPITWGTPSGGSVSTAAQVSFTIPGAGEFAFFSVWDGDPAAGGIYITGGPLDANEVFSDNGGTLNLSVTLTATDAA